MAHTLDAGRAAQWWSGTVHHFQEDPMPLINVRLIENVFTAEQKQQITHDLTEAMVAIEGERMRGVTWCVVEEVKSGDWAIGGQPLTTEAVQALARGDVSLPV
jgi:4-oxalocrotonate tautomerase